MIGKQFGRLTVLYRGRRNPKHLWWVCQCSCPKQTVKEVRGDSLRVGAIRSCGCLQREIVSAGGNHYIGGRQFGRLTIVAEAGSRKQGRMYLCKCRCRKQIVVLGKCLASGETKSCGCWYRDTRKTANLRHGKCPASRKVPVYSAYHRQRSLCRNPNTKSYEYYGGRSIRFLFPDFPSFYAEVGDKPGPDYWLMRRDSDGDFIAGNLEWVQKGK